MPAKNAPQYLTRVTVEGRHVTPPLVLVFDIDYFDINGLRHNQLVEIGHGLEIVVTSMNITRERDELEGYVEDAATFVGLLTWAKSGASAVRLVSAPTPSNPAG